MSMLRRLPGSIRNASGTSNTSATSSGCGTGNEGRVDHRHYRGSLPEAADGEERVEVAEHTVGLAAMPISSQLSRNAAAAASTSEGARYGHRES